jgi:hypothetical protein
MSKKPQEMNPSEALEAGYSYCVAGPDAVILKYFKEKILAEIMAAERPDQLSVHALRWITWK